MAQTCGYHRQLRVELGEGGAFAAEIPDILHGIAQAGEHLGGEDRRSGLLPQPGAESEQVPGEVAAVHTRDIVREQRLEGAGVVPIVKVPAVPLQLVHRGQRVIGALDQAAYRKIAEIAGRQIGQQRQSHVGGRCPRSDHRCGDFLKIVRWQPVLCGGHQRLEVVPRLARGTAQKGQLVLS